MTLADWDIEVAKLTDEQLKEKLAALDALEAWEPFAEHFRGFGTFGLRYTLMGEMAGRRTPPLSIYDIQIELYGEDKGNDRRPDPSRSHQG